MKIAHVINSLGTGGAERLVVDLAREGTIQGHEVEIIILTESDGLPHKRAIELNITVKVLGTSMKDPRLINRIHKATGGSDIVHVHLFPAMYWAARLNKPKVFTEHSTNNKRLNNVFFNMPERWVYQSYDRIIAISGGVEEILGAHFKRIKADTKITLVPNGITDDFFALTRQYSSNPTRVVSVGSLTEVKQHHLAIGAIAKLEGVTLEIAGDGPLRPELEQLIKQLCVSNRVSLLGNVDDVRSLLHRSDLFLSTSQYEGFGLAAVEAQATGIPVVGPDVEGFRDIVINNLTGFLYEEASVTAIANKITQALKKRNYLQLAKNTRENVKELSISRAFEKNVEVYTEVLNQF